MRQLEDGRDYLDLKWRLVWLRSREPEASIETQVVPSDEDEIVCRATISARSGASVTAHGSARRSDDESAVEAAENRALARALAAFGIGAEYLDDDDVVLTPLPSPPVNLMTARALMDRSEQRYETEPEPLRAPEPTASDAPAQPERQPESAAPTPTPAPTPATVDEIALAPEDISWTKFWAWAKPRGYGSALELGELLDVDVLSHTPGEIRRMIKRYELEHPPGGLD
jgi:hypothetical protein